MSSGAPGYRGRAGGRMGGRADKGWANKRKGNRQKHQASKRREAQFRAKRRA